MPEHAMSDFDALLWQVGYNLDETIRVFEEAADLIMAERFEDALVLLRAFNEARAQREAVDA